MMYRKALETSGADTGLNNDVSTAEIQVWSSSATAIDVQPNSNMRGVEVAAGWADAFLSASKALGR
jgi:hypothetical protein